MNSVIEYDIKISNINLFFDLINSLGCDYYISFNKNYSNNTGLMSNDDGDVYKKDILNVKKTVIDGLLNYSQIEYKISNYNTKRNASFKLNEDILEMACSHNDKFIVKFLFIKNSLITDPSKYDTYEKLISLKDTLRYNFDNYKIMIESIEGDNIDPVINLFKKNIVEDNYNAHAYQSYIYMISKYIYGESSSGRFQNKSGFKSLVNNVHNLDKPKYSSKVLPYINNYYLCEKTDGKRVLALIFTFGKDVYYVLISDKIYYVNKKFDEGLLTGKYKLTILDSELEFEDDCKCDESNMIYKSDFKLKVFDILVLNSENVTKYPFEKRLELLNKVKLGQLGSVKTFIRLTNKNYNKEILDFYNSVKDTNIDGLIFTPTSDVQYKVFNQGYPVKYLNKNYKNMYCYKWKPSNMITIDFYIRKAGIESNGSIKYILFSGINNKSFERNNLSYIENYKDLIPEKYHDLQYFPIQFSTIDAPKLYEFYSDELELDGKIGEFNYINNEWNLVKIRTDRNVELERGEYYGNNYDIALTTWEMIKNPMNIEDFKNDSLVLDNSYFKTNDNSTYQAQRNYNSFVKTYLLQMITDKTFEYKVYKNWIVDLACGKGQDLFRIANLGFKNGLFVDVDTSALYELNERKRGLSNKISMRIHTKLIDLSNTSYNDILDNLNMIRLNQANLVICNFAIHYFTENSDMITNVVKLISELINKNGVVIITCFDGQKIFDLLNGVEEYSIEENGVKKYSIIKDYKGEYLQDFGQKIKVLLPFSGKGEYYGEYLVNTTALTNIFNDNGFIEYNTNNFDYLFDRYNNLSLLSDKDKEYVSLYKYIIYIKK